LRYFIGLIAIIALIILLIILLIPGGSKNKASVTGATLVGYSTTNTVTKLSIDGPVVAQQNHESVVITVGKSSVVYDQMVGYNGQSVNVQSFPNTVASYDVFLHSLYYANYLKGDTSPSKSNESGVCPLGTRYVYSIQNGNKTIERFWSTSCGVGTFGGNASLVQTLFQAQVPDYFNLTGSLNL
jgi:hypothetical protein